MKNVYTFAVETFDPHRDTEKAEMFRDAWSRTLGAEGIHPSDQGLIMAYAELPLAEAAWTIFDGSGLKIGDWILDGTLSDDRKLLTLRNPVRNMRKGGVKH